MTLDAVCLDTCLKCEGHLFRGLLALFLSVLLFKGSVDSQRILYAFFSHINEHINSSQIEDSAEDEDDDHSDHHAHKLSTGSYFVTVHHSHEHDSDSGDSKNDKEEKSSNKEQKKEHHPVCVHVSTLSFFVDQESHLQFLSRLLYLLKMVDLQKQNTKEFKLTFLRPPIA